MDKVGHDIIKMMLKQLGAVSIESKSAKVIKVKYQIGEAIELKYLLEEDEESVYINRVSPYPILLGKFFGEVDVVQYIKKDIEKFKKAYNGKQIEIYMDIMSNLALMNHEMEQIFLNYETDDSFMKELKESTEKSTEILYKMAKDRELNNE